MHHFSKGIHHKLWYHVALSIGSALVTVALFDTLCSLSWLYKDYENIKHFDGVEGSSTPFNMLDIIYWIFVTYRMVLSLVICIGGIFMGRRIIVIVWLGVSIILDAIHLSETFYILSRPNLVKAWPTAVCVSSCIWQELKIIRIKYRIIRRSLLIDTNNNDHVDQEYEPETFREGIKSHLDPDGQLCLQVVNTVALCNIADLTNQANSTSTENLNGSSCSHANRNLDGYIKEKRRENFAEKNKSQSSQDKDKVSRFLETNAIHFIKLVRNLYNLLTFHFTGYLFGGDQMHLINLNNKALFLEERFIRYARIFLDILTVIYIIQEKKMLLTPWIMAYIMTASASIAIFLFILLHLNLLSNLFAVIYYSVFAIDLFFRFSFLIFCIRYVLETKRFV